VRAKPLPYEPLILSLIHCDDRSNHYVYCAVYYVLLCCRYPALDDEIYIGGIYVRIFLQQPQYSLRRPERFIEGLFEHHEMLAAAEGMAKDLGAVATGAVQPRCQQQRRSCLRSS
jgi:hypothetical protein